MPQTPPTGYVWAVRSTGVVAIPTRVVAGTVIPGRLCAPGDAAIIPVDECDASQGWLHVVQCESTGVRTDAGVSMFGIDGATGHAYYDTAGAAPGEEALLTIRNGNIVVDDIANVE